MSRLLGDYERDGFVQVSDVIPFAELDALRREVRRIVDDGLTSRVEDGRYQYSADGSSLRNILFPSDLVEELARLITHPGIVEVLTTLQGPDIEFALGKVVIKQPGAQATAPWHQDLPYSPHSNDSVFSIGLHLDDFSDGQGALRMVPGSHRLGLCAHRRGKLDEDRVRLSPVTTLAVPRGTMTVHHGLTIHEAARNFAEDLRLRIVYLYRASDSHRLGRATLPFGRHRDLLVSGQRRPARHQALAYQADIFSA